MKKNILIIFLFIVTLTWITGCAGGGIIPGVFTSTVYYSYDGPTRPTTEVSTLYWAAKDCGFDIISIDGEDPKGKRKLPEAGSFLGHVYIDMDPGLHDFVVYYAREDVKYQTYGNVTTRTSSYVHSAGSIKVSATLEPGKVYILTADFDQGQIIPKMKIKSERPRALISAEKEASTINAKP